MSPRGKSVLLRVAERAHGACHGLDPGAYDAGFVAAQLPVYMSVFGPGRYFDTRVQGLDLVPSAPTMLVSNHSGGTTALDGFGLMVEWYRHFGTDRPLHGLAHELLFAPARLGRYAERCGVLRARKDVCRQVLCDHGRDVLVMPGGDQEVWRPASQRYRVRFAGRTGYARTAIELGVPIVPVAHVGAHHTLHVLTDGRALARRVKAIRALARAEIWPIHLSLPWGLALGPVPHLPPPAALDYRLAAPIVPPPGPATGAKVAELDASVREAIQEMLLALREERARRKRTLHGVGRRLGDSARSLRELVRQVRGADARAA